MVQKAEVEQALADIDHPILSERLSAIQTLGNAKDQRAIPALKDMALDKDRDERTRAGAVKSLAKIGGKDAKQAIYDLMRMVPPVSLESRMMNAAQTQSLKGSLLSLGITAAIRVIGTDEAQKMHDRWQSGEFTAPPADTARSDAPSVDTAKSDAPPGDTSKSSTPSGDTSKSDAPPGDTSKSSTPSGDTSASGTTPLSGTQ
jgi:hypothetical protein